MNPAEAMKETTPDLDLSSLDLSLDLDLNLDLDLDLGTMVAFDEGSRYIAPKAKRIKSAQIVYANALRLARDIDLAENPRYDVVVSGDFIFGDFIEAYITTHNVHCDKMTISTLSLSQNNVDSLENLMRGGYVDELSMIVSAYFFSNERLALVPYMYQHLDIGDRFQLSVAGVHTKTVQWCGDGDKVVMHGSANLRSNGNIEQFAIERNAELYDFYDTIFSRIEETYATIRKPIRSEIYNIIKQ